MSKFKFFNQSADTAEILLYGVIGDVFDGITAKGFAEQMQALGNVSTINLRINSVGGIADDAMAIFNTLSRHPAKVLVDIEGACYSAATIVAMAGDERRIAENARMMIHNAWSIEIGDGRAMQKSAERLKMIDGSIAKTYASRTGRKEATFRAMMDEETWFNAEDAIAAKLADSITKPSAQNAFEGLEKFSYQNIPPDLRDAALNKEPPKVFRPSQADIEARMRRLRLDEVA